VPYIRRFYLTYESTGSRLQHSGGRGASRQGNSVDIPGVVVLNEDFHRYPSLNHICKDQKYAVGAEWIRALTSHLEQYATVPRTIHLMGHIMHFVLVSSRCPYKFERLSDVCYVTAIFRSPTGCLPELCASRIYIDAYSC
jgi:hypothetical protein